MTPKDYALIAARAADSKKGIDIVIQHVSDLLVITDYFVIVTGANDRQVAAIADEIEEKLREKAGIKPIGREGFLNCTWVLLDYGDYVIHVMHEESRKFYNLERLWRDCPQIDLQLEHPETSASAASDESDESADSIEA